MLMLPGLFFFFFGLHRLRPAYFGIRPLKETLVLLIGVFLSFRQCLETLVMESDRTAPGPPPIYPLRVSLTYMLTELLFTTLRVNIPPWTSLKYYFLKSGRV